MQSLITEVTLQTAIIPDRPRFAVLVAVMGFGPRALFFAPIKAAVLIPQLGIEGALYSDAITISVVSLFAPALMCDLPSEWSSLVPAASMVVRLCFPR